VKVSYKLYEEVATVIHSFRTSVCSFI